MGEKAHIRERIKGMATVMREGDMDRKKMVWKELKQEVMVVWTLG